MKYTPYFMLLGLTVSVFTQAAAVDYYLSPSTTKISPTSDGKQIITYDYNLAGTIGKKLCGDTVSGEFTIGMTLSQITTGAMNYLIPKAIIQNKELVINKQEKFSSNARGNVTIAASLTFDPNGKVMSGDSITIPEGHIATIQYRCGSAQIINWILQEGTIYLETPKGTILPFTPPVLNTCTLTSSSNPIVNLSSVSRTILEQSNEVSAGSFPISLTCQKNGGTKQSDDISVYVSFADATKQENTTDILTLTKNSSAEGVGLRIYPSDNSSPIKFSPAGSNSPTLINASDAQLMGQYKKSTGGVVSKTYNVKYVKTNTVSQGSVEGIATFQIFYQ